MLIPTVLILNLITQLHVTRLCQDIDQRFSVVSRALRRQAILSVHHMKEFLAQFFKTKDSATAHVEFVPWVYNVRDWVEDRSLPKWTQQVAKYHHYRFRRVPEGTFIAHGVDVPLYRARCHMKEWSLDDLEWYPPSMIDKKTREGIVQVPCHGLRILPTQQLEEHFELIHVAPFEGDLAACDGSFCYLTVIVSNA